MSVGVSRDGRSASVDDRQLTSAFLCYIRHFRVLVNVDELGPMLDALKIDMSPDTSSPSSIGTCVFGILKGMLLAGFCICAQACVCVSRR